METREYILDTLYKVFYDHGYASLLMRKEKFSPQDAGFISEVVYGTIRNYSLLEAQWRPYAKKIRKRTALLLDMSVYQLFFMDGIPAYAVISEAVDMAPAGERKFVNALLRRVQKEGMKQPDDLPVKYSHPQWLIRMWTAHYGEEACRKLLEYDQKRPVVYGRINTLKATKEELEADPAVRFVDDTGFVYDGVLQNSSWFKEGKVLIQNINSQQVAKQLDVQPGMKVLDACAAPGTKSQQIAMMMENRGSMTACDLYETRTKLIGQLMEKTGVTICTCRQADASVSGQFPDESFERILLDVPCSGLGDLSHKPEIRWHLKPEDIDEILPLQAKILDVNAAYLKPGGIMVYSTCTLNRRENEKQVAGFLKAHPEFTLLHEETLFPFETSGDGFYHAKMAKK